ncbi:MAG TPA: hypothetical protein VKU00_09580 [Chthonomonadaceae bacterium]|nr:hypothetical protein [Chthonomonadaceae bacterium]
MRLTWPKVSKPIRIAGCLLALTPFIFLCLPVCFGVREEALQVSCLSKEKEQGAALLLYALDFDDHLPPAVTWMDASLPYLKRVDSQPNRNNTVNIDSLRRCPSVQSAGPEDYGYAMNSLLSGPPLSKLKAPETQPLLFDSDWLWRNAHAPGLTSLANPARHNWGSPRDIVTYADGHAKSILVPGNLAHP